MRDLRSGNLDPHSAAALRGKNIALNAKRLGSTSGPRTGSDGSSTRSLAAPDDDDNREAAVELAQNVVKLLRKVPESALSNAQDDAMARPIPRACTSSSGRGSASCRRGGTTTMCATAIS